MPDKICPIMSRSVIQSMVEEQSHSLNMFSKLEEVKCLKENCAMWIISGDMMQFPNGGHCGLRSAT